MKLEEISGWAAECPLATSAHARSETLRAGTDMYVALSCIALVALLLRLLPLLLESGTGWVTANNSGAYLGLAEGLRHGCGFAAWTGSKCASPETSRTPGYPVFLAIVPGVRAAIAAQALLWSVLCLVTGIFASRRWGTSAGVIACLLLALDVSSFVYSNKIMADVPFSFLLAAAALAELKALERSRLDWRTTSLILLASLLFACATVVRPIAQLVVPLAFLFAVFMWRGNWRQRMTVGLLIISLQVLLIGGWRYRNWKEAGVDTFSTVAAFNLYNFRAAGTIAYATGQSLETVWRTWDQSHPESFTRRALEVIRQHPFAFAYMTCRTFVYLAVVPDRGPLARVLGIEKKQKPEDPGSIRIGGMFNKVAGSPLRTVESIYRDELDSSAVFTALVMLQLGMILLIWLGVAHAVGSELRSRSAWDVRMLFVLAMAILLLVLASGPETTDRFRIPAMPFLAMLSGIGWCRAWSHWKTTAGYQVKSQSGASSDCAGLRPATARPA